MRVKGTTTTNRCHKANSKADVSFKAVFTSDNEKEREGEGDF